MKHLKRAAVFLVLFLFMSGVKPLAQDKQEQGFDDEIRKVLQEGVELYKRGKYDEARVKIEIALNRNPGADVLYAFLDRVGDALLFEMMRSGDEQLRNSAIRLLEMAKPKISSILELRKKIPEYLEMLKKLDAKEAEVRYAMYHLHNAAPYSVSYLIPPLGDEAETTFKARCMMTLTRMGWEAAPALIEALKSKNPFMRKNAAALLKLIADERAIPALKRLYENSNERADVKKFANEALQQITKKTVDELRSAKEEFYSLAEKYYYGMPSVIPVFQHTFLIWKWDTEKDQLTQREAPVFAYKTQLAEEACYEALELDPNFERIWPLLACTLLNQYVEGKWNIEVLEKITTAGDQLDVTPQMSEELKKKLGNLRMLTAQANVPGKRYLYQALTRAMEDTNAPLARAIINVIREEGKPEDLPPETEPQDVTQEMRQLYFGYPLIEALTNDHKLIRYTASRSMVEFNPQQEKLGMKLVIPNLINALGETTIHTVLLIYDMRTLEDRAFVNRFKKDMAQLNIMTAVATSGMDGILRSRSDPFDVIFLQSKIANQVYLQDTSPLKPSIETILDALKTDQRTKRTPLYLFCKDEADGQANRQIYSDKAEDYLLTTFDRVGLKASLERVFETESARGRGKAEADKIAQIAAETLANMPVEHHTLYPYRDAIPALIKALDMQTLRIDAVRLPCIKALGSFADIRGLDVLAKLLDEHTINQKPIRLEAAKATSKIFRKLEIVPSEAVLEVLKRNITDGDDDIVEKVAEIIGNAKLTNEQRRAFGIPLRIKHEAENIEAPKQ